MRHTWMRTNDVMELASNGSVVAGARTNHCLLLHLRQHLYTRDSDENVNKENTGTATRLLDKLTFNYIMSS